MLVSGQQWMRVCTKELDQFPEIKRGCVYTFIGVALAQAYREYN